MFVRYALILLFSAVAALLAPTPANAAPADLSIQWINATQNTDNTAIPATGPTALKETRIEVGSCNADGTFNVKTAEKFIPMPGTSVVFPAMPDNTKYCFRGFHKNNSGQDSGPSNVVAKWLPGPTPKPPTLNATVNVAWREYSDGRFVLVGYVPLGTACDESRTIPKYGASFNQIPAESVTLFDGRAPTTGTYVTICGAPS